jgi:hypothetical protein
VVSGHAVFRTPGENNLPDPVPVSDMPLLNGEETAERHVAASQWGIQPPGLSNTREQLLSSLKHLPKEAAVQRGARRYRHF